MSDMLSIDAERLLENKPTKTKEIRLYVVDGIDRYGQPTVAYFRDDPEDMGGIGGVGHIWEPLRIQPKDSNTHQEKYLSKLPSYKEDYIVKQVLGGKVQLDMMKSVDLSTFRVLIFKRETYQKDTFEGVINIGK